MSNKAEDQEAAEPAEGVGLQAQGTATYTAALSLTLLPRKKLGLRPLDIHIASVNLLYVL